MLKISHFHTNTHTETFAPLITCVIDDTDAEKCSSRSTKFMTSMNRSSVWLVSAMVLFILLLCQKRSSSPILEMSYGPDLIPVSWLSASRRLSFVYSWRPCWSSHNKKRPEVYTVHLLTWAVPYFRVAVNRYLVYRFSVSNIFNERH